jgi:hypothetical protein
VTKSIDPDHARPEGVGDGIVAAVGKLTEALERVQRARGHLYEFHQLIGGADEKVGLAADWLEEQGEVDWAQRLRTEMVGRNVLQGRWTFQVIEEFDDGYYSDIVEIEKAARNQFMGGRRHVYEGEMNQRLRTPGRKGHESLPP